ncbi:aminoglycoside phosphotransferase family protein [Saccharothrix violaceirubra]
MRPWLDGLPALLADLTARWGLTVVRDLPGGNTSHTVLCTTADGAPAVLKVTPEPPIAAQESAALGAWADSPAVVDVLAEDLPAGVLLLEGLVPGTSAQDGPELPVLLAELGRVRVVDGFPPLAAGVERMFGLLARRRPGDYAASVGAASALAADRVPVRLLHGDLHLGNVLRSDRGLVAIDPRATVGDPAFDAVDFAYAGPDLDARVEWLSSVVDGDRLAAWCAALAPFFPDHPAVAAGRLSG